MSTQTRKDQLLREEPLCIILVVIEDQMHRECTYATVTTTGVLQV